MKKSTKDAAMEELCKILKYFSDLRNRYPDVKKAIEEVCTSTGLGQEAILGVLSVSGVYVLPDSEEENEIKRFIGSVDRTKITVNELIREVGFRFCISDCESKRLVEKWFRGKYILKQKA